MIDSGENDESANEKRLRVDGCKRAMMMSSGSIKGEKAEAEAERREEGPQGPELKSLEDSGTLTGVCD